MRQFSLGTVPKLVRAQVLSLGHSVFITSDKGGGKCVCPRLSVCLLASLLARLLRKACMELHEMLHVVRCRDMDELINF